MAPFSLSPVQKSVRNLFICSGLNPLLFPHDLSYLYSAQSRHVSPGVQLYKCLWQVLLLRWPPGGRHTANLKVTTGVEQSSISLLLKECGGLGTPVPEVLTPTSGFTLHRLLDFWEFLDPLVERKACLFHWDVVRILQLYTCGVH